VSVEARPGAARHGRAGLGVAGRGAAGQGGDARAAAVAAAGRGLAAGWAALDADPVGVVARAAWTPSGPPLEVLVARVRARRGLPAREAS